MRSKRLIAVLMLICTFFAANVLCVHAAEPTYEVSEQYEDSKYYENLKKVPITGNQATDVLAIALSQLGYREGNSEDGLGGTSADGVRDFAEYNVLYGKIDNDQGNGVSYGYYWCASFVNWCLRQAGVSVESSAAAEISCRRWLKKCQEAGIYNEKSGYLPKEGDLIFFKDHGSLVSATHIGFVLYSDEHNVYTIEGNTTKDNSFSGDGSFVALKSYSLTSSYIVGYASPKYEEKADAAEIDRSGNQLSAGIYISKCDVEVYKDSNMIGKAEILPAYEIFTVKEVLSDSFRIEYGDKEGYADIADKAVQMTAFSSLRKVSFLDIDGSHIFRTQYLLPTTEIKIPDKTPKMEGAGFVCWLADNPDSIILTLLYPGDIFIAEENDVELRAFWDMNLYTVSYLDENGNAVSSFSGYFGDTYEIPILENIPKNKEFVCWELQPPYNDIDELKRPEPGIIKNNSVYVAVMNEIPVEEIPEAHLLNIVGSACGVVFITLGLIMLIWLYRKKPE
jgi:hypothetical protein